eukprot:SM000942S25052  [mRNA]  locus=s942:1789:2046:- [translate_table: standard]
MPCGSLVGPRGASHHRKRPVAGSRSETYRYYDLPFCKSAPKAEGIFEVLEGYRMVELPYDVRFNVTQEDVFLYNSTLSTADLETF